jgi:D-beta-D-heptose 7-phosphate kinase/D-beta-D-heptose 1-phosphate adenosyltransferase
MTSDRPVVWVVGDAMLDRYRFGTTCRTCPEDAAVPVVRATAADARPGGAANVAANAAAMGAAVVLAAPGGPQLPAFELSRRLSAYGVDWAYGRAEGPGLTVKTRVYVEGDQAGPRLVARVDEDVVAPPLFPPRYFREPPPAVLVLSDYAKGALAGGADRAWVEWGTRVGAAVLVDPKQRPGGTFTYATGAAAVTPNRAETVAACRAFDPVKAVAAFGAPVVATDGRHGCAHAAGDGTTTFYPQLDVRAGGCPVGAGDSFVAGLAVSLAGGAAWPDAIAYAQAAGACA